MLGRCIACKHRSPIWLAAAGYVKSYSLTFLDSVIPKYSIGNPGETELDPRLKHSGVTPMREILSLFS
jgi:hypothetical protein